MYFAPKVKRKLQQKIEDAVGKSGRASLVKLNELLNWFIGEFERFYYGKNTSENKMYYSGSTITIYEREFIFDHLIYFLAQKIKEPWDKDLSEINYQLLTEKDFRQIGMQICSVLWHLYGIPSKTVGLFGKDKEHRYFEDLLSVLKEFGHRVVVIDRKLDFMSLYRKFFQIEPAIYFFKQYRDHMYHTIYIAVLGKILLEMKIKENETLLDIMVNEVKKKKLYSDINGNELRKAWFLASLLHDVGYIIKLIGMLESSLKDTILETSLKDFTCAIKKEIEEDFTKDGDKKKESGEKSINFDSHGIYSAMFVNSIKNINMWKDKLFFKLAQNAMIKHDSDEEVDFSKDPIAFLLVLLDEIQEYERPYIHKERLRTKIYYDIHSEGHQVDIREHVPKSILKISNLVFAQTHYYRLRNNTKGLNFIITLGETKFVTEEFRLYLEQHPTFILNNWISKKMNLERLKINDDLLNIKVTFVVPKDDVMDKYLGKQIRYLKNIGYLELEKYFGSGNVKNKIEIIIDSKSEILVPYYFSDNDSNFIKEEVGGT